MASGRILRKQISLSPQVNDLSLKAALLFTWLIPHVDDFGRIHAAPRRLKATIFPMRDDINYHDISDCLVELLNQKLIILYSLEDNSYLQLAKFDDHQQGLHKRTQSKIPPPEGAVLLDSRNFPEFPGNSHPIELNRTEQNRTIKDLPEGKSMSGKPDAADFSEIKIKPETPKNSDLKTQAREVLEFLNLKTGKKFRIDSDVNLKLVMARLKSGATVMQCRKVIAKKSMQWRADEHMAQYLRPKTLFGATNFEQYVGELVIIPEEFQNVR